MFNPNHRGQERAMTISSKYLASHLSSTYNPFSKNTEIMEQSSTIPHRFQISPNLQNPLHSQFKQQQNELDNALLTSLSSSPVEVSAENLPSKHQVYLELDHCSVNRKVAYIKKLLFLLLKKSDWGARFLFTKF